MTMRDVADSVMELMSFHRYATNTTAATTSQPCGTDVAMLVKLSSMRSDYYLQSCQKPVIGASTTPVGITTPPVTTASARPPKISPSDDRLMKMPIHLTKANVLAMVN